MRKQRICVQRGRRADERRRSIAMHEDCRDAMFPKQLAYPIDRPAQAVGGWEHTMWLISGETKMGLMHLYIVMLVGMKNNMRYIQGAQGMHDRIVLHDLGSCAKDNCDLHRRTMLSANA